jgi:hypothetical protein
MVKVVLVLQELLKDLVVAKADKVVDLDLKEEWVIYLVWESLMYKYMVLIRKLKLNLSM